jgi:2-hydroxycyclohexanecarboxyl-CoA dehydrogenase
MSRVPGVTGGALGLGEAICPHLAACAFLCSEAAGYSTGQVIGPNGGAVL